MADLKYRSPRGTSDILPEDQPYWAFILETAVGLAEVYGYQRVDVPIFEFADLYIRGVGEATDIVQKEMYIFEDRGGDRMALRPEFTAGICRAYLQHGMSNRPLPVKLWTAGPVFRYDRPQRGRYRQFHQFNYEAIGELDPWLDAEVIDLAWRFYERLGLKDLTLELNSIGDGRCRPAYREALRAYYRPLVDRLCSDCKDRLERNPLRLLDCKQPTCWALSEAAPRSVDYLCDECREHFAGVQEWLGRYGVPYRLNHRLVRGLDYYTKTVFEVQPPRQGAQAALGGGGRYDGLIEELGGRPTPGIGFATGMERIILELKEQGISPPGRKLPVVFVAYTGEATRLATVGVVGRVRAAGFIGVHAFGSRSLKSQLRLADGLGAGYALILGEEEYRQGRVVFRDMATGSQEVVSLEEALSRIRRG